MAPLGVALGAFALLAGAAASSAAAQAPAVAGATTDDAPNPSTLLADATVATSGASSWYHSTADRRTLAKKRGCNPKKNTSCCRDRKSRCPRWVRKKPTKCAKKGFQGKCRASCDAYWDPKNSKTDIEFCTPKGTMSWPGSKEELLAMMSGAPAKKPPPGSVDWTTGAPCVCTQYRDGATAEALDLAPLPDGKGILIPGFIQAIRNGDDPTREAEREFDLIRVLAAADKAHADGAPQNIRPTTYTSSNDKTGQQP